MSDVIEEQLREAFAARVETAAPRIVDRLSSVDFQPRRTRLRLFTKIAAAGGLITAGGVTAVLALASGTPEAFAGWTATPARVSEPSLASARQTCGIAPSTPVLAAESRGPFVSIVFVRGNDPWQCITRGSTALMQETTQYPARLYQAVPAGKITAPSLAMQAYGGAAKRRIAALTRAEDLLFRRNEAGAETAKLDDQIEAVKTGPEALISLTGTAARDVTAVRFVLADGKTVSATVQGGWYEAWWPGSSKPGGADAVRVEVTTHSGTRSAKIAYGRLGGDIGSKRCATGAACSVFAPIVLKQGIASALTPHFAFLNNTPPSPVSSMPTVLRLMITNPIRTHLYQSLGIDISQARVVQLSGGNVILILPGTEGLCETLADNNAPVVGHVAEGGCDDIQGVLDWGEFGVSFSSLGGSSVYTLNGLVPNGNKYVTVNMDSGAKLKVPVHDNIVYATFSTTPSSVTFKNAFGEERHHPA